MIVGMSEDRKSGVTVALIVVRFGIPAIFFLLVLSVLLCGPIRGARERARRSPHVSVFGQGSANHFSTWITATGEPNSELESRVGEEVDRFIRETVRRELESRRWDRIKNRPLQSRVLGLCISIPQLSARCLGHLRQVERADGIYLGLFVDASVITDDALLELKSLSKVHSITIRGVRISEGTLAELREALPDCKIEIDESPVWVSS
jgi:hypothetical protein